MSTSAFALEPELDRALTAFNESARALYSFVQSSRRGLEKQATMLARINARLDAATRGEPTSEPGPDEVQIELTPDESETLNRLLTEESAIAARFPTMLFEMALIYLVAMFDAYTADVFQAVLCARPETMRSRRQLTYEAILAFDDLGDLIASMAAREVNDVAYKGVGEQLRYYSDRFGVMLGANDELGDSLLVEIAARRNLLVHNAGVVNRIYLDAVPNAEPGLGQRLDVDEEYWSRAFEHISKVVNAIDRQLRAKFGRPSHERPQAHGGTATDRKNHS